MQEEPLYMILKTTRRVARHMVVVGSAASLLLLATQAPAQTPTMPRNQAEFEKMIGLTADQKKKIEVVNKKYTPQVQALQKKYQPQFEALQKQMQALQQKYQKEAEPLANKQKTEMEAILTPAQRKKVQEIQAMARQQGGPGAGGPGGP